MTLFKILIIPLYFRWNEAFCSVLPRQGRTEGTPELSHIIIDGIASFECVCFPHLSFHCPVD